MQVEKKIKKQIRQLYQNEVEKQISPINGGAKIYGKDRDLLPEELQKAAYGCGHPTKFVEKEYPTVLDLGCGQGVDSYLLKQKFPQSFIIGIDFSEKMLKKAISFSPQNIFLAADIENLPFKDKNFQLIISNAVIHLSPHKEKLFEEIYRVLTDQGEIIASDIMLEKGHSPHQILQQEFIQSEGLFLYGGIIDEIKYFSYAWKSNFEEIEILEKNYLGDLEKAVNLYLDKNPQFKQKEKKKLLKWAQKTRMNVVTYKLKKIFGQQQQFICPECGTFFLFKMAKQINWEYISPKVREEFKNLRINHLKCPNCNWEMELNTPFSVEYKMTTYHIFPSIFLQQKHLIEEEMKMMEQQLFKAGILKRQKLFFGIKNFLKNF